jgi:hypothetical protein
MFSLARELHIRFGFLTILRFKQGFQEHLTESVVGVLVDLSVIFLTWIQLFRLLRKFINRDLSNDQREVFSLSLNMGTFIRLSSNMSLWSKFEVLLHGIKRLLVLLNDFLLILFSFSHLIDRLNFLKKSLVPSEKFVSIDFAYFL